MSLEGNDPVIGHGGRVSFGRNQGGQPVTNGQRDLWGKGRASVYQDLGHDLVLFVDLPSDGT
jgi:hypothetical protein